MAVIQEGNREQRGTELGVVVPLYNEEENVEELHRRIVAALDQLSLTYEAVLVNDGSADHTPERVGDLLSRDRRLTAIHLSRNFGHQAAVCAG
jgi:dolichol-phosphate mannosyltransferase